MLFFGIGFGSRAVIFSAVTADIFSGRRFGSIYGYYAISVGAGGALGSWLGGFLHDVTGSYLIPFVVSTLLLALSDLSIRIISFRWLTSYDERLWSRKQ